MTYLEEHAPEVAVEILDLAASIPPDRSWVYGDDGHSPDCWCPYCDPDLRPGIDFPDGEW